ncbi:helix-turn-helix domain-containing protein [Devosia ginsengisoli]|uniref:Chromosomal replication initiator DnaA C-terminal domain-containing protein n=1 Tax=Devosia ginsengisoli TaxID=400770 RepID=A0A5B8LRN1_9HYPH|nr:helix-turn-helix domain-containing protein [Devosia ginsengisoli]QDZ10539.1 hypothetical protein FPZ08_07115 [Devosia ginsengisoli]
MNSYIPLLAIQSRPHSIIYRMPAREYSCSAEVEEASAAARSRLHPKPLPLRMSSVKAAPVPMPEPQQQEDIPSGAPLNMLTTCHWRFLVAVTALRHGVPIEEIMGRSRSGAFAAARHEALYLVVAHTPFSIARIGLMFGRHHTTVLHSLKKFPPIIRERGSPYAVAPAIPKPLATEAENRLNVVREGYAAGLATAVIAEQIGMSRSTVKQIALRHHLRHPSKPFYGAEPSDAGA